MWRLVKVVKSGDFSVMYLLNDPFGRDALTLRKNIKVKVNKQTPDL